MPKNTDEKNTNKAQEAIPQHIGIIMDGNGRWAKQRKKDRSEGHAMGIEPVKNSLRVAMRCGVKSVTVYVFSTENWKRPQKEVNFVVDMVSGKLREHYPFYRDNNIKVVHSGNYEVLGKKTKNELDTVIQETKDNTGLIFNLAFNYGGRDEIIRAFNRHVEAQIKNDSTSNTDKFFIDEESLAGYLDVPAIANIDLMIRTGKEKRISNFLLWEIAYAELYFSDVLWPDWSEQNMEDAINYYSTKHRRFGGL